MSSDGKEDKPIKMHTQARMSSVGEWKAEGRKTIEETTLHGGTCKAQPKL